ncbi:MAG: FG-GAP-like repeat-containing protein [Planctomycetes bacterium]|nr:FG-GAP-like repeat-containing protein [Planctomycetota bacterium]
MSLLVTLFTFSACGGGSGGNGDLASLLAQQTGNGGGGGTTVSADAPSATISLNISGRPKAGNVAIPYTLSQTNGLSANISAQYSVDGGAFAIATPASTNEGTTNLWTSPSGSQHVFTWSMDSDIPAGSHNVVFRITPSVGTVTGAAATTSSFAVSSQGSTSTTAPTVSILSSVGGMTLSGNVTILYQITDQQNDIASVTVSWSTTGTSFSPLTLSSSSSPTSNLLTTSGNNIYTIVWDSNSDLFNSTSNVVVRVTPADSSGAGTPVDTPQFTVSNGTASPPPTSGPATAPTTTGVTSPAQGSTVTSSPITIVYVLSDQESSTTSVAVEYWTGASWLTCTEVTGTPSEGITGLTTSPAGVTHTFVWNASQDLGTTANLQVFVRVVPTDTSGTGTSAQTDFVVNLSGSSGGPTNGGGSGPSAPPTVTIQSPTGGANVSASPVTINYTLTTSAAGTANVAFEYWDGSVWQPCTEFTGTGSTSQGKTNLSTSPSGSAHVFQWDIASQPTATASNPVFYRVVPTNTAGAGQAASDNFNFGSSNVKPTTVAITSPGSGTTVTASPVVVRYTVSDPESDTISIAPQWWDSPASAWRACTEFTGTGSTSEGTTGLTSSPSGVAHVFEWDAATDLGATANLQVYYQIVPSDAGGAGTPNGQYFFNVQLGGSTGGTGGASTYGAPLFAPNSPPSVTYPTPVSSGGAFGTAMLGSLSGINPGEIDSADFDFDGDYDLALCDTGSSNLYIFDSNGNGTFTLLATIPVGFSGATSTGNAPRTLKIGDFNNDGWPDIMTLNQGSFDFSIVANLGGGTFVDNNDVLCISASAYQSSSFTVFDACIADFDGDGNLDVGCCSQPSQIAFNPSSLLGFLQNPGALFNFGTNQIPGGTSEEVTIHLGGGDTTFAPLVGYTGAIGWIASCNAGDVNGDGKPEMVIGNLPSAQVQCLAIYQNQCTPGTVNFVVPPSNGTAGASQYYPANDAWVASFGQNGNGASMSPMDFEIRDMNGDGWNDFIFAMTPATATNTAGQLMLAVNSKNWPAQGASTFNAATDGFGTSGHQTYSVGANQFGTTIGDFNGDGKLDAATANTNSNDVSVLLNTGSTTGNVLSNGTQYAAGLSAMWIANGDFNGDGKLDIAVSENVGAGTSTGGYSVLLGQ